MRDAVQVGLAIIVDAAKTRVLIGVRPDGVHQSRKSEFPGGKVETGEMPEQCAIREAWEETGLVVKAIEQWPAVFFEYSDRSVALHPFLCEVVGTTQLPEPWKWAEIASLNADDFPAANVQIIRRLRDRP